MTPYTYGHLVSVRQCCVYKGTKAILDWH